MTTLAERPLRRSAPSREVGHTQRVEHDPAPSDQDLINAAARGDAAAFEALYRRHRNWIFALAWRFTQDADLAADVTQEAFAYLIRRLPSLTLTAKLTTLLYPVVKHESRTALRKRRRMSVNVPGPVTNSAAPDADLARTIRAAVDALGDSHAEIVLLRYVHDMELHDIAEALSLPLGTVKSRLHRAHETLKQSFPKSPA